jgi:hypothetical protein
LLYEYCSNLISRRLLVNGYSLGRNQEFSG